MDNAGDIGAVDTVIFEEADVLELVELTELASELELKMDPGLVGESGSERSVGLGINVDSFTSVALDCRQSSLNLPVRLSGGWIASIFGLL